MSVFWEPNLRRYDRGIVRDQARDDDNSPNQDESNPWGSASFSKQQLADIRKGAERSGSPAGVYVAEGECYSGINDVGQALIQEHGLKICPCSVPKSDVAELNGCLSRGY